MKGLQLWSGTQHTLFCRESRFVASYTRDEGGRGSQKVTNDDEGEGGVTIPPKIDDVIYEQPLIIIVIILIIVVILITIRFTFLLSSGAWAQEPQSPNILTRTLSDVVRTLTTPPRCQPP